MTSDWWVRLISLSTTHRSPFLIVLGLAMAQEYKQADLWRNLADAVKGVRSTLPESALQDVTWIAHQNCDDWNLK